MSPEECRREFEENGGNEIDTPGVRAVAVDTSQGEMMAGTFVQDETGTYRQLDNGQRLYYRRQPFNSVVALGTEEEFTEIWSYPKDLDALIDWGTWEPNIAVVCGLCGRERIAPMPPGPWIRYQAHSRSVRRKPIYSAQAPYPGVIVGWLRYERE